MSRADLVEITGKTRYSKQAEWFKDRFGIDVTCRGDGSIVMMWETFAALNAKKAGVAAGSARPKVELCSPYA
jgi:hypothetical protein